MARELAALTRLGALRHLDLQVVRVDEVLARHAEPRGRHLLHRAAPQVAVGVGHVPRRILAAFSGIRPAAEAVHRNRERLVRLGADRPVRHRARGEPLEDRCGGLDLLDRDRRPGGLQAEQTAQRRAAHILRVNRARVFLEDRVLPAARRVLQLEHGLRVEEVILAVAPPLVFAAGIQLVDARGLTSERALVAQARFLRDDVDADAADARRRVREEPIDELLTQANRLEDLRAAVAGERRNAHLGHHLQDALVERLHVMLDRVLARHARDEAVRDHVVDRLERQIRVHHAGAVAEQQRHMMHFARVARLDNEPAPRARPFAHEVMVHAGRRQQARNRRKLRADAAVGEDQDVVARRHRVARAAAQVRHRFFEPGATLRRVEGHLQRRRPEH